MVAVDKLMIVAAIWALLSAAFHAPPGSALVFRMGHVYNVLGIYFLIRVFCSSVDDMFNLARVTALLLVPVAIEMLNEQVTQYNFFSMFGGVPENPAIREGRLRAQGPFAHSILAGTVGAVTLPMAVGLWSTHRKTAIAGGIACCAMVLAASSSGPILSAAVAVVGLCLWRFRQYMRLFRWCAVLGYFTLDAVMKVPAFYLMARIDITGGSTGWHRAYLIDQAFKHLPEWWFAGTDHTRHWMPTGVTWSENHADITNYYLHLGVVSGLPLMLLHITCLWLAFRYVGEIIRREDSERSIAPFVVWVLGVSLASHAATGIAVSYFDQSFLFLYLTLAAIVSLRSATRNVTESPDVDDDSTDGEPPDMQDDDVQPGTYAGAETTVPWLGAAGDL